MLNFNSKPARPGHVNNSFLAKTAALLGPYAFKIFSI